MASHPPAPRTSPFPSTRLSLLGRLRDGDASARRHAFDALAAAYWKPIYAYLRLRWRLAAEDAEDVTQGFLTAAYDGRFFDRYDPSKARFRTFLRVCLDRFVLNQRQAAGRQKRNPGVAPLPLDVASADGECRGREPATVPDLDALFRQEVVRALFAAAVDRVREDCARSGRTLAFRLFERYDLEPDEALTYADLGARFGLTVAQVTNHLALARRLFRTAVLERLRDISATDEEFRLEARELFGVDVT